MTSCGGVSTSSLQRWFLHFSNLLSRINYSHLSINTFNTTPKNKQASKQKKPSFNSTLFSVCGYNKAVNLGFLVGECVYSNIMSCQCWSSRLKRFKSKTVLLTTITESAWCHLFVLVTLPVAFCYLLISYFMDWWNKYVCVHSVVYFSCFPRKKKVC